MTALAPDRIVMEATSGLELLATSLQDVGLPVVVVRLCQARAIGRASVGCATRPPTAPMPNPAGGTARTCFGDMKFRCTTRKGRGALEFLTIPNTHGSGPVLQPRPPPLRV